MMGSKGWKLTEYTLSVCPSNLCSSLPPSFGIKVNKRTGEGEGEGEGGGRGRGKGRKGEEREGERGGVFYL